MEQLAAGFATRLVTDQAPLYEIERRRQVLVLLAILLLHAAVILGWTAHKRVAHTEVLPTVLPIWNILLPKKAVDIPVSDSKSHPKAPQRIAPRHIDPQAAPVGQVPSTDSQATVPSPAPAPVSVPDATASPRLDYDSIRGQALDIDKHREISPIDKLHQEQFKPHTVESGIADAAKRGKRGDCQTEYAGMGILAVVPLVVDTVTDRGCKWK